MNCCLHNKEPLTLVSNMEMYFKNTLPDCSLFSKDNCEIPIHKELLYQTKFARLMIESVGIDSKLDIICHELTAEELENVVDFLYYGRIVSKSQTMVSETLKNLEELFGFPSLKPNLSESEEPSLFFKEKKKSKKLPLNSKSMEYDYSEPYIKIENDHEVSFIFFVNLFYPFIGGRGAIVLDQFLAENIVLVVMTVSDDDDA